MKVEDGVFQFRYQAPALRSALQGLIDQTPLELESVARRQLEDLVHELASPHPSPDEERPRLETAVLTLKDLVTAYHEAGHVLAYQALTPRNRVRLDSVCFDGSAVAGVEAGMTYTRIAEPWWPDPQRRDEVVRELACVLAGKAAEPALSGGVQLNGSDQDDQEEAAELLDLLPENDWEWAEHRARTLLGHLDLHARVPSLAAQLYERWCEGDTVIPISELVTFLPAARETR